MLDVKVWKKHARISHKLKSMLINHSQTGSESFQVNPAILTDSSSSVYKSLLLAICTTFCIFVLCARPPCVQQNEFKTSKFIMGNNCTKSINNYFHVGNHSTWMQGELLLWRHHKLNRVKLRSPCNNHIDCNRLEPIFFSTGPKLHLSLLIFIQFFSLLQKLNPQKAQASQCPQCTIQISLQFQPRESCKW